MPNIIQKRDGAHTRITLNPTARWAATVRYVREALPRPLEQLWQQWEKRGRFAPRFDVHETHEAYTLSADLPGVREEDLEMTLGGERLTIGGKRDAVEVKRDGETTTTHLAECPHGAFRRSFTLPGGIDSEKVRAELQAGVLTVVVPKRPEAQAKRITVRAAERGGKNVRTGVG